MAGRPRGHEGPLELLCKHGDWTVSSSLLGCQGAAGNGTQDTPGGLNSNQQPIPQRLRRGGGVGVGLPSGVEDVTSSQHLRLAEAAV